MATRDTAACRMINKHPDISYNIHTNCGNLAELHEASSFFFFFVVLQKHSRCKGKR